MSTITSHLTGLAAEVIAAKRAAESATAALKAAQDAFAEQADLFGHDSVLVDGTKVAVVRQERRTFDVESVREHFPLNVLAKVIRESVDPKAFDAAVTIGVVTAAQADKAVAKVTEVTQVRVYD
jgi:hypothetical protein